ncbi:MAG: phosphopantetheine-binding protein [Longimicrobiales bacterium]
MSLTQESLITFVQDSLLRGNETIDAEESLIDRGLVDSIGLMQLMGFIEENAGVRIPDHLITPDNFQSVTAMMTLVEDLKKG